MKKLLLPLIAISLSIVLVGCGSKETVTEPEVAGKLPTKNADGSDGAGGAGANARKPFDANNP